MGNSILTTTKNTTPHRKLTDEQLNPHNKKPQHHTQSYTMNNSFPTTTTKKYNSTHKAK
jgi:hypothetical protein